MPYKDKKVKQEKHNLYRKQKRLDRGLQKQGRKELSAEEKEISKQKRKLYEKEYATKYPYCSFDPVDRLYWAAKRRAKVKNLEFNIEKSDIKIPTLCPYLGLELVPHSPRGTSRSNTLSLDRIDPTKGYIKGNVEVISHIANTMKTNATVRQLQNFALEILNRHPL